MARRRMGTWQHHWMRAGTNTGGRRWGVRFARDSMKRGDEAFIWHARVVFVYVSGRCYYLRTPFYPSE